MKYKSTRGICSHKKTFSFIATCITVWQQPLKSVFPSCCSLMLITISDVYSIDCWMETDMWIMNFSVNIRGPSFAHFIGSYFFPHLGSVFIMNTCHVWGWHLSRPTPHHWFQVVLLICQGLQGHRWLEMQLRPCRTILGWKFEQTLFTSDGGCAGKEIFLGKEVSPVHPLLSTASTASINKCMYV